LGEAFGADLAAFGEADFGVGPGMELLGTGGTLVSIDGPI
jgi:hypothetical protein